MASGAFCFVIFDFFLGARTRLAVSITTMLAVYYCPYGLPFRDAWPMLTAPQLVPSKHYIVPAQCSIGRRQLAKRHHGNSLV